MAISRPCSSCLQAPWCCSRSWPPCPPLPERLRIRPHRPPARGRRFGPRGPRLTAREVKPRGRTPRSCLHERWRGVPQNPPSAIRRSRGFCVRSGRWAATIRGSPCSRPFDQRRLRLRPGGSPVWASSRAQRRWSSGSRTSSPTAGPSSSSARSLGLCFLQVEEHRARQGPVGQQGGRAGDAGGARIAATRGTMPSR